MKNTIINLAIIGIAILSGSDAFASFHHKHNVNALELTGTNEKVFTNQSKLQSHSGKSIVLANHSNHLVLTSSARNASLITKHHFLDVWSYHHRIKKQLNLESQALASSKNQLGKISWQNFRLSNVHENIGETISGSG